MKHRQRCVYLITDGEFYKIGKSVNVESRVAFLESSGPRKLSIVYLWETEKNHQFERFLHRQYRAFLIKREWFSLTPKQIKEIKLIKPENVGLLEDNPENNRSNLGQWEIGDLLRTMYSVWHPHLKEDPGVKRALAYQRGQYELPLEGTE